MSDRDPKSVVIGTRGSPLALAQAHEVRDLLLRAHALDASQIIIEVIKTTGDQIQDRALSTAGGKGLFTKEIEEALFDGGIDLAVHSGKDMPTVLPDGLELSCWLPREDVRDAFICEMADSLETLPQGAKIGTASLRREAIARFLRPDLDVVLLRGNVQTRLEKLRRGDVDATLLAVAGLNRLGLREIASKPLSQEVFLPAVAQGAIAIETRVGDERISELLKPLNDDATEICVAAERAFLAELDGSCRTPIAAYAHIEKNQVCLEGAVYLPDGTDRRVCRGTDGVSNAAALGHKLAAQMKTDDDAGFFDKLQAQL